MTLRFPLPGEGFDRYQSFGERPDDQPRVPISVNEEQITYLPDR